MSPRVALLGVSALAPVRDTAPREIVRRKFDVDVVAGGDADAKAAQTSREARENRMAVLEFDFERRARKRFDDTADEAQCVFLDDGGEGFAAFLAAAPPSTRWWNTGSFRALGRIGRCNAFGGSIRFARAAVPQACGGEPPGNRSLHKRVMETQ